MEYFLLLKSADIYKKAHFFEKFKGHDSRRNHGNYINDPFFINFRALTVSNI